MLLKPAALDRDALVNQEDRDPVADRVDDLAVLAHEARFESFLHWRASAILRAAAADLAVDALQQLRARLGEGLMGLGTGEDLEEVLVDHGGHFLFAAGEADGGRTASSMRRGFPSPGPSLDRLRRSAQPAPMCGSPT